MERRALGQTGLKFSRIAIGGTTFAGFYGQKANVEVLHRAYELGVNYFDAAPWYTNSETIFAKELSQYPPDTYHLTTKIGRYQGRDDPFDFSAQNTRESIYRSLDNLNKDLIDVVYIHDAEFAPSKEILLEETIPVLNEFKQEGLIKNIGIACYPLDYLVDIIEKSPVEINCIITYCRATLQDETLLFPEFTNYFKSKNVGIVNGSVNAMSMLTSRGPSDWHPAGKSVKEICAKAAKFASENGVNLPRLATSHSSTLDCVSSTLFAFHNVEELNETYKAFTTPLTVHEEKILKGVREILAPVKNRNWENSEVAKYWRKKNVKIENSRI